MAPAHRFDDEWLLRAVQTLEVLPEFIAARRAEGVPSIVAAAVAAGLVGAEAVTAAVERLYGVKTRLLTSAEVDRVAMGLIPERVCRRYLMLPFKERGDDLDVLMANPLDAHALEDVKALSGRRPVPSYCPAPELSVLIEQAFAGDPLIYDVLAGLEEALPVEVLSEDGPADPKSEDLEARAPVIKLVNSLITKAVRMRASDIHLEHGENVSLVRFRVDGELQNILTLPRAIAAGPLAARFKVMASLDISDHRRPQDGRAKLLVGKAEIGLRVSTLPTQNGEKVVVRLLDKRLTETGLEALGIDPAVVTRLDTLCARGQGVILVTGPTGSGKTTTLYALLQRLKTEGTNIVTVEDPIEYRIPGVNQVQVNEKAGLGFATVLRSVLRQDPDIILVGEIRDRETADIAMQAALTGHLVLSTMHTNDSLAAVARLEDMGVERFKMQPALLAVTAQRLARRLCLKCAAPRVLPVPKGVTDALAARGGTAGVKDAMGCEECSQTGYRGRQPIVEFLEVTPAVREKIGGGEGVAALRRQALSDNAFFSLADDALRFLAAGVTTLDEVTPFLASAEPAAAPFPDAVLPPAKPAPPPPVPAAAAAPKTLILVADDDSTVRIITRMILEKEGFRVRDAENGAKALAAFAEERPALVMSDLNMPVLDGLGLIQGIRESLGDAKTPILVLTANQDDDSQIQAIRLGADDYLVKPLKPNVVVARVRAALRRAAA